MAVALACLAHACFFGRELCFGGSYSRESKKRGTDAHLAADFASNRDSAAHLFCDQRADPQKKHEQGRSHFPQRKWPDSPNSAESSAKKAQAGK